MSENVAIAEAVRAAFAAGYAASPRRVSQDIAVSRIYVNRPKLDDLVPFDHAAPVSGAIQVFITPDDEALQDDESTRGMLVYQYPIIVGIAGKPKSLATTADVDALHQLRQDLKDYFFQQDPAYALPGLLEGAVAIETISDMDRPSLREKGLFLAEFVVTFEGGRSR